MKRKLIVFLSLIVIVTFFFNSAVVIAEDYFNIENNNPTMEDLIKLFNLVEIKNNMINERTVEREESIRKTEDEADKIYNEAKKQLIIGMISGTIQIEQGSMALSQGYSSGTVPDSTLRQECNQVIDACIKKQIEIKQCEYDLKHNFLEKENLEKIKKKTENELNELLELLKSIQYSRNETLKSTIKY